MRIAYSTMDTPPKASVDTVGVRFFLCVLAKARGSARYTAIDNEVRAVGRIVVWVEAAAEVSTRNSSRCSMTLPYVPVPNTASPRYRKMSDAWSVLFSPMPLLPMPANACEDRVSRA